MPRRYYNYLDQFQPLHQFSTVGAFVLGAGFTLALGTLLWSLKHGKQAPANPWGGLSLEWQTQSPPVTENFEHTPTVTHGAYDYALVQGQKEHA
jgi:cytochrome c oxidase subunit 1